MCIRDRDRCAESEQRGVWIMASAHAVGRARKDDAVGFVLGDLGGRQVAGENFGEEALAAEPSSDKLGVLRAVVENAEHGEGFLVFKSARVVGLSLIHI